MAVIPGGIGITKLTVFNTLVPQDHPGNIRQLGLPQEYHERTAKIYVDHDRLLGMPNRDEPLIADPAQAVFVVKLMGDWESESPAFLVVRMRTLIKQTYSTRADSYVPWSEWGRDAVVMEGSALQCVFVHGARVVVVREYIGRDLGWPRPCIVQAINFSLQGCSFLPVWAGGGGTEKRVLLQGRGFPTSWLNGRDQTSAHELLSDGNFFFLVSCLSQSAGSEAVG